MLPEIVQRFLEEQAPGGLLVGVSGGMDSVVLLHLAQRRGRRVVAAHVNYGLRGADSAADEAFVRTLCTSWNVPLHVHQAGLTAEARSRQEAAREIRYAFFRTVAEAEGVGAVAVAHHADDQIETILLNLLRGAGPEGLAGMPAVRPLAEGSPVRLVRPLLTVRRAEIAAYAHAEGLSWREDASNENLDYRRNALRHDVLPRLAEHFGEGALANVARSGTLLRDYVDGAFRETLARHFEAAATAAPDGGRLDLGALGALPEVWRGRLIVEALRRWMPAAPVRAAVVAEIDGLRMAQPGRRVPLAGGAVWRGREALAFVREEAPGGEEVVSLAVEAPVRVPGGTLVVERLAARPERLDLGPAAVVVDAAVLEGGLAVRRWRAGDRFVPLGLEGSKNVSDLLTDARVPVHRRAEARVVCAGEEIVWLVGHRLAEAFRVGPETRAFAKITFIPETPPGGGGGAASNPTAWPVP